MNAARALTLRSFLLALRELSTISPEIQTALQNLPSDPAEMMPEIYKLIKLEPLATQYQACRDLLQSREGVRSKGDRPNLRDETTTENDNISSPEDALENQGVTSLLNMVEEIKQNFQVSPKTIIDNCMGLPTYE